MSDYVDNSRSIEAQVAAKCATEVVVALINQGKDPEPGQWVKFFDAINGAVEKVSGPRPTQAAPPQPPVQQVPAPQPPAPQQGPQPVAASVQAAVPSQPQLACPRCNELLHPPKNKKEKSPDWVCSNSMCKDGEYRTSYWVINGALSAKPPWAA